MKTKLLKKNPQNKAKTTDTTKCLLCGKTAKFTTIRNGYQEPETYKIYCCDSCNTSFSLPRVTDNKVYELIYKNSEFVKGYDRYNNYKNIIKTKKNPLEYISNEEPSYWGTAHAIKEILKTDKNSKILEIGSGLGYFTFALRAAGYNIQGLDISQEAVHAAIDKFGPYYICDDLNKYSEQNIESYDVILMTEVIEHLDEPLSFITSIKNLLKPNGAFIFTTPNKSFFPKRIYWNSDAPPVHCWWFSEESVEHIANSLNMQFEFVNFSKYYKKHPFINKIENIDEHVPYVFNSKGDVNVVVKAQNNGMNFEMPKFIKNNRLYAKIRNKIFLILFPNRFKVGSKQSNVICAILYKI